jgi:phytoene dehydrogenase-like protein
MLRVSDFLGHLYTKGGSQGFSDEQARRFEEMGGHILLKTAVSRIATERNRVTGVVFETGPQRNRCHRGVSTDTVVSNADLRQTIFRMLEPEILDREYVARVTCLRPTYPCFLSHIGVQGIPEETLARTHGYHWRSWDAERVGADAFDCKIFVPTLYEPEMAPPGHHVVIVQKVTEIDYDAIDDWATHKQRLQTSILAHLQRLIPEFQSKIVLQQSASARTSHRFTLNYHGAMLGWEMSPDQLGDRRPDVQSPINGLLFVGQWTRPGGGITPVIVSAIRVARIVTGATARRPLQRGMRPTAAVYATPDDERAVASASEGGVP